MSWQFKWEEAAAEGTGFGAGTGTGWEMPNDGFENAIQKCSAFREPCCHAMPCTHVHIPHTCSARMVRIGCLVQVEVVLGAGHPCGGHGHFLSRGSGSRSLAKDDMDCFYHCRSQSRPFLTSFSAQPARSQQKNAPRRAVW